MLGRRFTSTAVAPTHLNGTVELDPLREALRRAAELAVARGVSVDDFMRAAWTALMEAAPGLRERVEAAQLVAQLEALRARGQVGSA